MAIMQEAMTKANFERAEKGLPPFKPKKVVRPEPEKPEVENEIKFSDIKPNDFIELTEAKRNTVKNAEGVRFIGFDVVMKLKQKGPFGRPKKTENGEPAGPKIVTGWMAEGNFLELMRTFRETIRPQVVRW